jgi:acetyltransferase-like isoleucine patch superfamily enzyme
VIIRCASICHHSRIGKHSNIALSVFLAGLTHVVDRCPITIGTTILDRLSIGDGTIIGAGSLVTKDKSEAIVAYGVRDAIVLKNEDDDIKNPASA